MIHFELKHPRASYEMLGFIPSFLSDNDPRPAKEQLHEGYAHGGGWCPIHARWTLDANGKLRYPGDPPMELIAETKLQDEVIRLYEHAIVVIVQPDGSFEVARMD